MTLQRGMGRAYQRGKLWWVQYSFRGKVYRESSGSINRNDAVKLLKRRLSEIGRGRLTGHDQERVTFSELTTLLLDDYLANDRKSVDRAQLSIKRLSEFFGQSRALDITTDRIMAYIRWRKEVVHPKKTGAAPATIRCELAALKRSFNLAIQAEKLTHKPHIPALEVRNVRSGFFEEADLKALLSHLDEDLRPVVEFAYHTGWRKGEILPLQWRQVDVEAGTVRLEPGTTKNDEGRTFPFGQFPALKAVLDRQWEKSALIGIPWVFHRSGRPILDFRSAWDAACKKAGLSGRLFHDLRRTAVRNLERAGVPRSVAMKLTGHKTESVYRRYAIVCEADLAEGVKKLAALSGANREVIQPRSDTVLTQFKHTDQKADHVIGV